MTEEEKTLIRDSFAKAATDPQAVAAMFYGRLFAVAPEVRSLFKGDMNAQGRKLMAMIGTAVQNLDRLDAVVPAVRELGQRHVAYGARPEHYPVVGEALLWTLEQGLGEDFTPATKAAWTTCYTTLATVMQEGAGMQEGTAMQEGAGQTEAAAG